MRCRTLLLIGFGVACLASPPLAGWAQAPPSGSSAAPAAQPRRVEAGFELRWRNEFRDNADLRPTEDFDHFLGQRLRVHLRVRAHADLSFFLEAQDVWLFGAEHDKVIHDAATNLHQLYFDWRLAGSERWELRAGRQELIYGKERLIGAFNWDNVGRSFDAGRLRFHQEAWTADFLWGRVVDVRRNGARTRPGHQDLSGVYVTHGTGPARTEIYGLFLRDGLRTAGELARPAETTRIFTLGFRRVRQPKQGFRYEVENDWQAGSSGPDRQRAVALVAAAGYGWGGRWQPTLGFEYDFASGDKNPTDGRAGEFNNLFPTNHLHYGYADLVGLRNLHDFRLTASARLHPKLTLQGDYHRFLLARARGPWKNAGGRVLGFDPTGASGRDLGQEVDLTVRFPVAPHLGFLGGYSLFLPGRFAMLTRGPEPQHFAYLQTTVSF